jgi:sugar phosphate isomerase/epimerase
MRLFQERCTVILCRSMSANLSRRAFSTFVTASPLWATALYAKSGGKKVPVGLELYTVREELKKDEAGTLAAVAKMGYECVEFYAPYSEWTTDHAKEVRKQLDSLNLKCYSTHNGAASFTPEGLSKAAELNSILGSKYVIMASPGKVSSLDDWKRIADTLNKADKQFSKHQLHAGYHNHIDEWKPENGVVPLEVLASNTEKSVVLQLDVGHCVAAGGDPVAWINAHPGRIRSMHLKDWSTAKQFDLLIGEGAVKWPALLQAAEKKGGVEYYLIEQEGGPYTEMEAADRSLVAFKNVKA